MDYKMLSQALRDPEYWKSIGRGVTDSVNRGAIGGILGAPVDIANTAMKPFGFGADKPVMGSEWLGDKMQQIGMVSNQRNPVAEGFASFIDPATIGAGAAKVAAYGAPLVAALGATAIGSKASEGARINLLAKVLKSERGMISTPFGRIPETADEIDKFTNWISSKGERLGLNVKTNSSNVSGSRYVTFKNPEGVDYQVRISNHGDRYPNVEADRFSVDPDSLNTFEMAKDWLKEKGINLDKRPKPIPKREPILNGVKVSELNALRLARGSTPVRVEEIASLGLIDDVGMTR